MKGIAPINERVRMLRKEYLNNMKQAEFAEKLSVTDGLISAIELGKTDLQDRTLKAICSTFGVNEAWLKYGVMPVFSEEIPGAKDLLDTYRDLIDVNRKLVVNHAHYLLETQGGAREENGKAVSPQAKDEKGKKANDRRADVSRSASSE